MIERPTCTNTIVLDANFIMMPFQLKIDYIVKINDLLEGTKQFIIFRQILDELEAKKRREPRGTKFQGFLRSGLSYIEKKKESHDIINVEEVKEKSETTDDFLVRKGIELKKKGNRVYLATNDQELRRRAKKAQISVIFLRQKKFLTIA